MSTDIIALEKDCSGLDIAPGTPMTYFLPVTETGGGPNIVGCDIGDSNWKTLEYGKDYQWRVVALDDRGSWSLPSPWQNFTTEPHPYPNGFFICADATIGTIMDCKDIRIDRVNGSTIIFENDPGTSYGPFTWEWTFSDLGETNIVVGNNPSDSQVTKYFDGTLPEYHVYLRAIDNAGYTCPRSGVISVSKQPPKWKEVVPIY